MQKCILEGNNRLIVLIGTDETDKYRQKYQNETLLFIYDFDWNSCLSPWPAQKVFRKGEDFAGGADAFISELIPAVSEVRDRFHIETAVIAGYSLAGLFSLYLCTKTDLFDGAVSASGSLWYPDFTEYLRQHPVRCGTVYLSLGDREKLSKSPVMSTVEDKTKAAFEIISGYCTAVFEMNPGGHFADEAERTEKGIDWVLKQQAYLVQ
ncbi:MAG: hypothetical protein K6D03_02665 [Solobacterium sp.]|nr:hypothetical protein [Solobacterium sp.]